jgi:hypothetical protein
VEQKGVPEQRGHQSSQASIKSPRPPPRTAIHSSRPESSVLVMELMECGECALLPSAVPSSPRREAAATCDCHTRAAKQFLGTVRAAFARYSPGNKCARGVWRWWRCVFVAGVRHSDRGGEGAETAPVLGKWANEKRAKHFRRPTTIRCARNRRELCWRYFRRVDLPLAVSPSFTQ